METLVEKYGFINEHIADIKAVITNSLTEILPTLIKEIAPTLMQQLAQKTKSEREVIEEMSRKRKAALK